MRIALTDFALRNWQEGASTRILGLSPEDLVALCNASDAPLVDGYAPFCKHLFIENPSDTRAAFAPVLASHGGTAKLLGKLLNRCQLFIAVCNEAIDPDNRLLWRAVSLPAPRLEPLLTSSSWVRSSSVVT